MPDDPANYVIGGLVSLGLLLVVMFGIAGVAAGHADEARCKERGGEFHPFRNGAWICVKPGSVIEEQR